MGTYIPLPLSLYGYKDPNLWVQALSYFASGEEYKGKISEVLQHIEENHLMPPSWWSRPWLRASTQHSVTSRLAR